MDEPVPNRPAERRDRGLPVLSDEEAWKRLPKAERGGGQPLPSWARALADALPRTTAAMLELDYRQRALSPLDARLRAKVRWTAAHADRCAYTEAVALADLGRAGSSAAERAALIDGSPDAPDAEKAALTFARKMTLSADAVADDEVTELRRLYGDEKVVALVLLLAYSNFQDRLILALGVPPEPGDPPPLDVRFVRDGPAPAVPPRRPPEAAHGIDVETTVADPDWKQLDFDALQKRMDGQRAGAAHPRTGLGRRQETPARRLSCAGPPRGASAGVWSAWGINRNWPRAGRLAPAPSPRRRGRTASSRRACFGW